MRGHRHPIAHAFVSAHLSATSLPAFPGRLPASLDAAYAIQRDGIDLWPHDIVGWKVARIAPAIQPLVGAPRLIGPVFDGAIQRATGRTPFPVIAGGNGALEAEIVVRLAKDAPVEGSPLTTQEARALVDKVHIGIEIAGSAFAGNSAAGPIAMVCGLGNSLGLILGPEIEGWRDLAESIDCVCRIDGEPVGETRLDPALTAPFDALAFACQQANHMGLSLRAGQWISTGAITGVHRIVAGQSGSADFGRHGRIDCLAVAAQPVLSAQPA